MSLAIAYGMKQRGKKMASGGCAACGNSGCEMCQGGMYAEGGKAENYEKGVHESAEEFKGQRGERYTNKPRPYGGVSIPGHFIREGKGLNKESEKRYSDKAKDLHRDKLAEMKGMKTGYFAEGGDVEDDMVGRIMSQRSGGAEANDTEPEADFAPAEFDDMVTDDHLDDANYTGANSGDELGNAQEDEDQDDVISRIMRSRRLKDRMPRPA